MIDQFKNIFLEEAFDYIDQIEQSLLILEKSPDKKYIENIFRAMHSLKGGGAMFGFLNISKFTHQMENLYEKIRNNEKELSKPILDITFRSIDLLKELLNNNDQPLDNVQLEQTIKQISVLLENTEEVTDELLPDTSIDKGEKTYYIYFRPADDIMDNGTNPLYLIDELVSLGYSYVVPRIERIPDIEDFDASHCYIYWETILATSCPEEDIKDVFLFVEDESDIEIVLLADGNLLNKTRFVQTLDELRMKIPLDLSSIKKAITSILSNKGESINISTPNIEEELKSIKVSSSKIDLLMNLVSELVIADSNLQVLTQALGNENLAVLSETIGKLTTQIKTNAIEISMVPISAVLVRFQRLVRDLAAESGKKIIFETAGENTQLDKNIIEHLIDPILHIIRNCVSHGIEDEKERVKLGKDIAGKIRLKAYYAGTNVIIEISDDGKGFNTEEIYNKALKQNLIADDVELSEQEILSLTLLPGFSTAAQVNDLSGRGVGMDVVNRSIENIKGDVQIINSPDYGSTIKLTIPLTLSIIDGLHVKVDDTNLIIPVSSIDYIDTLKVKQIQKQNKLISLKSENVVCVPLFFNINNINDKETNLPIVILNHLEDKIGLVVHQVIGQSQIVVKPAGKYLAGLHQFLGASVLGNGEIAYIIDPKMIREHTHKQVKTH